MRIITSVSEALAAIRASEGKPVLIYKHSPACGLCDGAILAFQEFTTLYPGRLEYCQVDVLAAQAASNQLAASLEVRHESPQALLLFRSQCRAHASHRKVTVAWMEAAAEALESAFIPAGKGRVA